MTLLKPHFYDPHVTTPGLLHLMFLFSLLLDFFVTVSLDESDSVLQSNSSVPASPYFYTNHFNEVT